TSHIHETLAGAMSGQSIIVGPSPSPIERINRQHRFQILLKYKREPALLDILTALDEEYHEKYKKVGISLKIDVNPLVILYDAPFMNESIIFMGTPDFSVPVLRALQENHGISMVI